MATTLAFGARTLVMGVINVTPDSFSGDGVSADAATALEHGRRLVAEGADLLDVGGESTRPGFVPVPAEVERERVEPAIRALAALGVPLSVDTRRSSVAAAALQAGAGLVNDVTGLRYDPGLAAVAARHGAWLVLGHWPTPGERAAEPDVVRQVIRGLRWSVERALAAGVPADRLLVDPGLGFARRTEESLTLLRRLAEIKAALGLPLVVGPSRKGFIGRVLGLPPAERVEGTAACVALAVAGGADLVRVHDVRAMVRVTRMADAVVRGARIEPAVGEAGRREPAYGADPFHSPVARLAYVGLGSNLGDRAANLQAAVARLERAAGVRVLRQSSLWESAPWGVADQPWFLNSVVELLTTLSAEALLETLKATEAALGRAPGPRWGPRLIDLDLLLYDDRAIASPDLVVPHPRLWERRFVLEPLAELRPGLRSPDGRPIQMVAAGLAATQAARRWPRV